MEKSATLNLRVNPTVKKNAEEVLLKLGIPMSTAIDIYLNQIALTGGLPFPVTLPDSRKNINADSLSKEEIYQEIEKGIRDLEEGRVMEATKAFEMFRKKHLNDV